MLRVVSTDKFNIIHAGCIAAGVGMAFSLVCLFACLSICLFVRALKGIRLEPSTPNVVHMYSIVVARHALTQRSKRQRSRSHGYENHHRRTVASDACYYGRVHDISKTNAARITKLDIDMVHAP